MSLGEYLGAQIEGATNNNITSLNYRQTRITGIFVRNLANITSITAPNLVTVEGHGNTGVASIQPIQIDSCGSLATANFPALQTVRTGMWFDGNASLTSCLFPSLTTLDGSIPGGGFEETWFEGNNALQTLSFPSLVTCTNSSLRIRNNTSLQTLSLPVLVPNNGCIFNFQGNALNQASVDGILARCVANAGYVSGQVLLAGGTNSAPSAGGLADKATLIGRGVTVTTN